MIPSHAEDRQLLVFVKGAERYVFLYDAATRTDVCRAFGRFAADPELTFTWHDAAVLSQRVRQIACEERP